MDLFKIVFNDKGVSDLYVEKVSDVIRSVNSSSHAFAVVQHKVKDGFAFLWKQASFDYRKILTPSSIYFARVTVLAIYPKVTSPVKVRLPGT